VRQTAEVLKAMADPLRLRLLRLLLEREACVCELVEALAVPQYRASKHLRVLRNAGLVADRRAGNWIHYSLTRRGESLLRPLFKAFHGQMPEGEGALKRDDARFRAAGRRRAAGAECA
jgi:ArsR family transcriptional regulator